MSGLPSGSDTALAPLRQWLLADARERVSSILDAARDQALATTTTAEVEAARIRAAAAAAGEETARSEAALRSARVRRQAHQAVLESRNALHDEVRRRVRVAAIALTADPRYPAVLERLRARAVEVLGPDVIVTEGPDGGLVAVAGSRSLDLTLPTLADAVLKTMAPEISGLWATP
ncbi:MAG: hypothetical protein ABR500_02115 [Dermatophilaceae bacterium]|nr:hypothetical protein [Intrasporangiaceae bacterium]